MIENEKKMLGFQEVHRLSVNSPMTVVIYFTVGYSMSVENASVIMQLIQMSQGDEKWFELLLSSSCITIGRHTPFRFV